MAKDKNSISSTHTGSWAWRHVLVVPVLEQTDKPPWLVTVACQTYPISELQVHQRPSYRDKVNGTSGLHIHLSPDTGVLHT